MACSAPVPRYVALLRGVSPLNATMPDLRTAFETAGFTGVKTVLASGNVVFASRIADRAVLERRAEAALKRHLGCMFLTIVRPTATLERLLESDPFARHRLPRNAKRVVTFLRAAPSERPKLPCEVDGARILAVRGGEVFVAYVVSPKGAVFMRLIEKTFGTAVTTRTWETLARIVRAGADA